jgi:poly(3-hydroxybutyrate) depolymerase
VRTILVGFLSVTLWAQAPPPPAPSFKPSDEQWRELRRNTEAMRARVNKLAGKLVPDVEVYVKAAEWLLRYPEECYTEAYYRNAMALLGTAAERAAELERGTASWTTRKGRFSRGYRSRVDASVQPYALVIPESYDSSRPARLDVVLHGRGATLTEVSFLTAHDSPKPAPADQDFIQLEVFGRGNNAYRWAGETDVFEALAAVESQYNIDPRRIVLRGFSMGGAGAWHIGLHYPDHWAAIEAGAGFTETRRYARMRDLPPWQEKLLRIYDAMDYARNAFHLPVVGYGGDQDPQLQASLNVQEQLKHEALPDLRAIFLVGPHTGHKFHPVSKEQSEKFILESLAEPRHADRIRFVTYTARYNRCFWVTVDGLERHYERTEVDADRSREQVSVRTKNVARLTLAELSGRAVTVDGQEFAGASTLELEKRDGRWTKSRGAGLWKSHGLQGPIDDAFMDSFLCVRPGKPHPDATAILDRFAAEFAKWMRGDVRVKEDRAVTAADMAGHHLILFGDASTNRVLARLAGRLPLSGKLPVLIHPNPLNPKKYVVLNSGHTFGEREFRGTNALLFPRLGDWAEDGASGFFSEGWKR